MRRSALALAVALIPAPLAAQTPIRPGWSLTLAAEGIRFGQTARERENSSGMPIELRPSGRVGARVALERSVGAWRIQMEAGWAAGDAEAATEAVALRDKTLDMSRLRIAPALERRVSALATGELAVGLAPTLDLWRVDGDTRPRLGLEARAAVRVPLGRMALENRLAFGLSASPLELEELEEGFELRRLRALSLGVGLRVPL